MAISFNCKLITVLLIKFQIKNRFFYSKIIKDNKNSFPIFILVFYFMNSTQAIGSPSDSSCNIELTKKHLVYLGLKPTLKNNMELIQAIEKEYGEAFSGKVGEKDPNLKHNQDGLFSVSTLKLINEVGFKKTFSPGVRFIFSPFNTATNDYGAFLLLETLLPRIYPVFIARVVFSSEMQLKALKEEFKDDISKDIINNFLTKNGVEKNQLDTISNRLFNQLFENGNYILASQTDEMKKISGHRVLIIGYSNPGNDEIFYNGVKLHYKDVVEEIIKLKMPPNITFDLLHNYAGVGEGNKETGENTTQLKLRFIHNKIKEIWGDESTSYSYKFSAELYTNWPDFFGNVIAYTGEIVSSYKKGYIRDPNDKNKLLFMSPINSIALQSNEESKIRFDLHEMKVVYNKNNFN